LAAPNLQTRDYWLGEIDGFTNNTAGGELVPVDATWRATVQGVAGTQPLDGFDIVTNNHWVPFTFNFSVSSAERIVGATLSLSMRATNSAAVDVLYISSVTNGFTFSALNWLPVSTSPIASNATVRVTDLSGQINLLTNGQLNLAVQGDIGIDWAVLELQVAPATGPGTYVFQPVADATVRGGIYSGTNFGSADTLTVKSDSSGDFVRQAYLRWDLTGITQTVDQARMTLTPVNVGTNGIEQGISVSASDIWSESSITWNNQPGGGERFANWISGPGAPITVDVTPQVLDALAGDKQLSLMIFSVRSVGGAGLVDYASREYADANSRPRLTLHVIGVAIPQPRITSCALSAGNLLFAGTNGAPGWSYYILSSTNVALPIASWKRLATNQFSANGTFASTNAVNGAAQQYFLLQLQ
jgi:hypothetical protein